MSYLQHLMMSLNESAQQQMTNASLLSQNWCVESIALNKFMNGRTLIFSSFINLPKLLPLNINLQIILINYSCLKKQNSVDLRIRKLQNYGIHPVLRLVSYEKNQASSLFIKRLIRARLSSHP